ncbi:MAG: L-rhamnose mutarotase [bacterium]|nr:L-rhamnose mutarotase [bacterium]
MADGPEPVRLSHCFRVNDAAEYARRHAVVWPEIEELLRRCGFRRYDIYLWGDVAVSFIEVDDYAAAAARYNESAAGARWEEHFADLITVEVTDELGWPKPFDHVWSL